MAYVSACFDQDTGGFRSSPESSTVDLANTVQGHVALVLLGRREPRWINGLLALLNELVVTADDVWTASCFLKNLGLQAPSRITWAELATHGQGRSGVWSEGADRVTTSARRATAIAFLGIAVPGKRAVEQLLASCQDRSGGWTDTTGTTLEATYQVVRALRALNCDTDLARTNAFIALCRRPAGLYAGAPEFAGVDLPPGLLNTYFALTVDRWVNEPGSPGIV
jgi:hypothetical protein